MKIAFFQLEEWEEELVRKQLEGHEVSIIRGKIDALNLPKKKDYEIISIFTGSVIGEEVLNHLPDLKFIAASSTGFDHVDLKACQKKGVTVSYVPGYGDNTVAEFAFGLILALTRKIYDAARQIKEECSFERESLRGVDLRGKTIGVVGTGRIGKEAIRIAQGFGMKVIAYDPYEDADFQKIMGFEYVSLEDLLKNSDVITIHCPYCKPTHHLINKGNIQLIKKGAFLVNTARGGIVETDALVEALRNGVLKGVALDVLEEENQTVDELELLRNSHLETETLKTVLQNHVLMKMPNVLITPHNAFNTEEALQRILNTTLENIQGFIAGKPKNLVPNQ